MSSRLDELQLRRLSQLFVDLMASAEFEVPKPPDIELTYTGRVLRPAVEAWVMQLRKPSLLVRGDGSVNASRALAVGNLVFYPDIEIVSEQQRCLAVEVKFLRPMQDPTGSLAKAIGQAVLYRELGFSSTHAVLVDLRGPDVGPTPAVPDWSQLDRADVHVHWFRDLGGICKVVQ